jgi:uncharacterized protein (TIGR02217 family)
MTIPAWRLPPEVEEGMKGGPAFYNVIQESISGQEQRVQVWAKCRGRWECTYAILDKDETSGIFRAVVAAFRERRGSLLPFRFKDWGDFELTNENIGVGNNITQTFQVVKSYDPYQILLNTPGSNNYVREIYLPLPNLVVKVGGVTKVEGMDYTLSGTGEVFFPTPPASGNITVTGEFDVPVRFDLGAGESLPISVNSNTAQIDGFALREVIGADELS